MNALLAQRFGYPLRVNARVDSHLVREIAAQRGFASDRIVGRADFRKRQQPCVIQGE